jgi:hypothetical protein
MTGRDTCTFRVERTEAIDQTQIVWQFTCNLVGTGAPVQHTISSRFIPPRDDWAVDFAGLSAFAERWLWSGPAGAIEQDIVPDGTVNLADFAEFANNWGRK